MPRRKKGEESPVKRKRRSGSGAILDRLPPTDEDINTTESTLPDNDEGEESIPPLEASHSLTPKGTPYVTENKIDGNASEDEKIRDFNEWMRRIKVHFEQAPDQHMFRIVRTYPRMSSDNQIMAGSAMTTHVPFCQEWMEYVFTDGGRFNVQFLGANGAVVRMFANISIPRRILSEGTKAELAKLAPFFDDIPLVTKNIEDRIAQREGRSLSSVAEEPMRSRRAEREDEEDDDDDEEESPRLAQRRFIPPPPPPAFAPPPRDAGHEIFARLAEKATEQNARQLELAQERADKAQTELMKSLSGVNKGSSGMQDEMIMKMVSTLTDGIMHRPTQQSPNEDTRKEIDRLHGVISEMTKAHASEIIRLTNDHKSELTARINELRDNNDRMMREINERHSAALRETNERYQDKITETGRSRDDHEKMIREQLTETKLLLSAKDSEVNRLNTEVMRLNGECTLAKAELQSRSAAHDMEVKSAVLEAKFAGKRMDEDPFTSILTKVKQAKELSESLGAQLGGPKTDSGTEAKKSWVEGTVEVAKALGGSKEFRSLAQTVVEAGGKAAASIIKARGESKAPVTHIPAVTTADIMASHRRARDAAETAKLAGVSPARELGASAPNPAPAKEPQSVVDSVAEAADEVARIKQIAEDLLDQIEEFAALETPLGEASDFMIDKLVEASGASIEEAVSILNGSTAEKTLEELDLPPNRLSAEALAYMNRLIAYTVEAHQAPPAS